MKRFFTLLLMLLPLVSWGQDGVVVENDVTLEGEYQEDIEFTSSGNIHATFKQVNGKNISVKGGCSVTITMEGDNQFDEITVEKGAVLILEPATFDSHVAVSSVKNGGYFEDKTASIQEVVDLDNYVIIRIKDKRIIQTGHIVNVSAVLAGNSWDADYDLDDSESKIERWNEKTSEWEQIERFRSSPANEDINESYRYAMANTFTNADGIYRWKFKAWDLWNENEEEVAVLYYQFEVRVNLIEQNTSIGSAEEITKKHMLTILTGEDKKPLNVELMNVEMELITEDATQNILVKEFENVTFHLKGNYNNLGIMRIEKGAKVSMTKDDATQFDLTVYSDGQFTDETGDVSQVYDLEGNSLLEVTSWDEQNKSVEVNYNSEKGHLIISTEVWDGTNWVAANVPQIEGNADNSLHYSPAVNTPGKYRFKISYEYLNESAIADMLKHRIVLYRCFSIAQPIPDYPDYYNIYMDACEGVTADTSTDVVREGSSMTFTLEVADGYTAENMVVKFKRSMFGYWETVTPDADGTYQIRNIYTDIYIQITGVEEENPTGIEQIAGVQVYTRNGSLFIQTPQQEQVSVISVSGTVLKKETVLGLRQFDGLQRGVYIVCVGNERIKVRL